MRVTFGLEANEHQRTEPNPTVNTASVESTMVGLGIGLIVIAFRLETNEHGGPALTLLFLAPTSMDTKMVGLGLGLVMGFTVVWRPTSTEDPIQPNPNPSSNQYGQ